MVVYKLSSGVKDYLVTPWVLNALKCKSYLQSRGIDSQITKYQYVNKKWKKGRTQ